MAVCKTTSRLYDLIISSTDVAAKQQGYDGYMPAGHNGPYYDLETGYGIPLAGS